MGELLCPLPGAGLSGGSLPCKDLGGTTPVTVATFGNLYSAPTVTREQSICRSWRLWGGAADLLSSGQEHPCCPGPSGPLPVPGEAKSWDVSWRPVLWGLRCWIHAPVCAAASPRSCRPAPLAAPGQAAPSGSRRLSTSELLPEPHSPLCTEPLPLLEALPPSCSRGMQPAPRRALPDSL